MQFLNYDLSEWYPIPFTQSGRYALQPKKAYWSRPGLAPFLVQVQGELAGFAVVDDEVVERHSAFNMGYFFVARRFRNQGVGRFIANHLLGKYPGRWEIYFLQRNAVAGGFWRRVLDSPRISALSESVRMIHGKSSVLFEFAADSAPPHIRR